MLVRGDPSTISCPVTIHQAGEKLLVGCWRRCCTAASAQRHGERRIGTALCYTAPTSNCSFINKCRYMIFTQQIDSLTLAVTCSSPRPRFVLTCTIYFQLSLSPRDCGTHRDPRVRDSAATLRPSEGLQCSILNTAPGWADGAALQFSHTVCFQPDCNKAAALVQSSLMRRQKMYILVK